jgi:membrane protease YdiL (CAAX protease family)
LGIKIVVAYLALSPVVVLWVCLVVNARRLHTPAPWDFGLVILGIILSGAGITGPGEVRIGLIWVVLGLILPLKRQQLPLFYIGYHNLRHNLLTGVLWGLALGLVSVPLVLLSGTIGVDGDFLSLSPISMCLRFVEIAVGEELLFRSFVQGYLRQQGVQSSQANLIQAILFMLVHLPRYLEPRHWPELAFAGIFGCLAGHLTNRDGNVAGAIVMHGVVTLFSGFLTTFAFR